MALLGSGLKSILRAKGMLARAEVRIVDKGFAEIKNRLKSIQTDRTYVKAGLLAGKAGKPRPRPALRIEGDTAAAFAKAQAAVNPVLLGVLAHAASQRHKQKSTRPLTNVQLGLIHEFGGGGVPARPFIRPAFAKHRGEYLALLGALVRESVYKGKMPIDRAFGIIGAKMAADMKKFVTTGTQIPPPNEPHYLEEKVKRGYHKVAARRARAARGGQALPEGPIPPPRTLVDTGRMVGSITYAVIHRSSGEEK